MKIFDHITKCEEFGRRKGQNDSRAKLKINQLNDSKIFSIIKTKDSQNYTKENERMTLANEKKDNSECNPDIKQNEIKTNDEILNDLKTINCKNMEYFEILEQIGKGGESKVYKAFEKRTKKVFALKIILKKKSPDIHNELKLLNKLKNKNLTNYYGSFEIKKDEYDCIVMNLGKFGNLIEFQNKLINKNYLSESILCFITNQVLCGLSHLNKCKICHYDIKPQNIIVDDTLNLQIIDYSISEDYSKFKSPKIKLPFRGTSFYMSPEVIRTDIIDMEDLSKVDLYSFGVVLFYFAFGYFPFNLKNEDIKKYDIIYDKIMKDLIIENEDNYYSPHFIDFLTRLLEKDIKKRISIYEALNHYWVKGAQILLDEKEQLFNASTFLSYLVTDHIKKFDDYIKKSI